MAIAPYRGIVPYQNSISGSTNIGTPAVPYADLVETIPQYTSSILNPTKVQRTFKPNYYTDYNDTYAINSVADVLLNKKAKRKRYGDWVDIPLLGDVASTVVGAADLLYNGTVKPILGNVQYGFEDNGVLGALSGVGEGIKQAGVNALTNVGETMDVVANPVKAALIEGSDALGLGDYGAKYDGNVLKGVSSALGFGDNGRVNYDWDTGNFVTDLIAETASDPLNWISLGTKAAASAGAKAVIGKAVNETVGAGYDKAAKKISKAFTKAYTSGGEDAASTAARLFSITNKGSNIASGDLIPNQTMNALFKNTFTPTQTKDIVNKILYNMQDNTLDGIQRLAQSKKLYDLADGFESKLFKSALYSTGFGEAYQLGKSAALPAAQKVIKKINAIPEQESKKALDLLEGYMFLNGDNKNVSALHKYYKSLSPTIAQHKTRSQLNKRMSNTQKIRTLVQHARGLHNVYPDDTALTRLLNTLEKTYDYVKLPLDPVSKYVYQKITPLYKTGYLTSAGFPMRNLTDGIVKNAMEQGGLSHIPQAVANYTQAYKQYADYEDLAKRISEFARRGYQRLRYDPATKKRVSKTIKTSYITPEVITVFFKKNPGQALTETTFRDLHRLVTDRSDVLSGMSHELRDTFRKGSIPNQISELHKGLIASGTMPHYLYDTLSTAAVAKPKDLSAVIDGVYKRFFENNPAINTKTAKTYIKDTIDFYNMTKTTDVPSFSRYLEGVYGTKEHNTVFDVLIDKNPVLSVNEGIERSLRLSMYNQQRAMGKTHGEAIKKIEGTHFIYDNKPFALKAVETYFPFTGFTLKNAEYWDNKAFGKTVHAFAPKVVGQMDYSKWKHLVSEMKNVPQYSTQIKGRVQAYYAALDRLNRTYFNHKLTPSEMKAFVANLKHFIESHKLRRFSKQNYDSYMRSIRKNTASGRGIYNLANIMTPITDLEDMTNPALYDYENRERPAPFSLEPEAPYNSISASNVYRMRAGNALFGDKHKDLSDPKGRKLMQGVMKLNPSWMDAFSFMQNPISSISGRLLPIFANMGSAANDALDGEMYQTPKEYMLDALPVVSTLYQRYKPVPNRVASTKNPLMYEPSIFGTTASYAQFNPDNPDPNASEDLVKMWYGQYRGNKLQHNPYDYYPQYAKQYRYPKKPTPRSISSSTNYQNLKQLYSGQYSGNGYSNVTRTYYKQQNRVRRYARPRNFYKDLYTSTGKSRMQLRMGKQSAKNLHYRVKDIQYIFKRNWYYLQ